MDFLRRFALDAKDKIRPALQRNARRRRHRCDSRNRADAIDQVAIQLRHGGLRTVLRRAQRQLHRHDVVRIESDWNAAEIDKCCDQQAGSGEEDHGDRNFTDHQRIRKPMPQPVDAGARGRLQDVPGVILQ